MISVIVPYYRQPAMLAAHLDMWETYTQGTHEHMKLIIVDDCSPEPALSVISAPQRHRTYALELYRVKVDIPWNRSMARNLGSKVARTPWLLHMDTDHLMPRDSAAYLWQGVAAGRYKPEAWYKFRRWRVGAADFTRNKDAVPRNVDFAEIKPHVDSFLCSKDLYWKVGGYDPDYAGCLGGGGSFLRQLKKAGPECMADPTVHLHVYTTNKIKDASILSSHLSRDTDEYGRRRRIKERAGNTKVTDPIRYPWERVL